MQSQTKGAWMVLLSAAGFSTLAIFIKFAQSAGLNSISMTVWRFLMATIMLIAIIKIKNLTYAIDKSSAIKLILMGSVGYGTMSMLFASSLEYCPASLSAMLLYTYPALVTIIAVIIGDEKLTLQKSLALIICFAGLFLTLGVSFAGIHSLGIFLALGASLVYSCYIIIGNRVLKTIDSLIATTWVSGAAGLMLLLVATVTGTMIFQMPSAGWIPVFGMAFFATVVAVLCFFAGMQRVGAANASIISTAEPLLTVILSALILGEKIAPAQAGGGLLILLGVVILQWKK